MKKALLVSFFKSGNIGDILIAEKIVKILSRKYCLTFCDIAGNIIENTSIVTNDNTHTSLKQWILNSQLVRDILGKIKAFKKPYISKIIESAKKFDMVIFAGGNMIMDLGFFSDSAKIMRNTILELKKGKKEIMFLFCGFGPFKSLKGETYFKEILKLSDYVTVRDEYSYEIVKRNLPNKDVEIWRDPVLLSDTLSNDFSGVDIGVNVFFGVGKSQKTQMKKAYISLIAKLRQIFPNKKILLFSSEGMDYREIYIIKQKFEFDDFVEIEKITNEQELFDFYKKTEFIIASRMHTAITAIVSHIPVIAVAWQGKVASLMSALNLSENCFTVSEFENTVNVSNQIKKILTDIDLFRKKQDFSLEIIQKETAAKIEKFLEI